MGQDNFRVGNVSNDKVREYNDLGFVFYEMCTGKSKTGETIKG